MASKGGMGQVSRRRITDPPCGGLGSMQEHYKIGKAPNEQRGDSQDQKDKISILVIS